MWGLRAQALTAPSSRRPHSWVSTQFLGLLPWWTVVGGGTETVGREASAGPLGPGCQPALWELFQKTGPHPCLPFPGGDERPWAWRVPGIVLSSSNAMPRTRQEDPRTAALFQGLLPLQGPQSGEEERPAGPWQAAWGLRCGGRRVQPPDRCSALSGCGVTVGSGPLGPPVGRAPASAPAAPRGISGCLFPSIPLGEDGGSEPLTSSHTQFTQLFQRVLQGHGPIVHLERRTGEVAGATPPQPLSRKPVRETLEGALVSFRVGLGGHPGQVRAPDGHSPGESLLVGADSWIPDQIILLHLPPRPAVSNLCDLGQSRGRLTVGPSPWLQAPSASPALGVTGDLPGLLAAQSPSSMSSLRGLQAESPASRSRNPPVPPRVTVRHPRHLLCPSLPCSRLVFLPMSGSDAPALLAGPPPRQVSYGLHGALRAPVRVQRHGHYKYRWTVRLTHFPRGRHCSKAKMRCLSTWPCTGCQTPSRWMGQIKGVGLSGDTASVRRTRALSTAA